jgi:hypothetical protein
MEIKVYTNTKSSIEKCCSEHEFDTEMFSDMLDSDIGFFFLVCEEVGLSDQSTKIPEELDENSYEPIEGVIVYDGEVELPEILDAWQRNGFECSFIC